MWDDKTPDFRGIWRATGTAYVNLEGHPGGNGLAASASIIVDPPDGKIPYKPEARAQRDENYRARATADPSLKCYQAGVPRATYLATPLQILQSPGNFAIVYEENHAFRVFHTDDRPHFDATDWWMGDTRYRWEGDTLVADVVALIDQLWLDQAGNFHSTEFHVVERYRLTGADTLEYEARIEDPVVYSRPWTLRTVLQRVKEPGARIIEDECLDDDERRSPSHLAVRSQEPPEVRLLALEDHAAALSNSSGWPAERLPTPHAPRPPRQAGVRIARSRYTPGHVSRVAARSSPSV